MKRTLRAGREHFAVEYSNGDFGHSLTAADVSLEATPGGLALWMGVGHNLSVRPGGHVRSDAADLLEHARQSTITCIQIQDRQVIDGLDRAMDTLEAAPRFWVVLDFGGHGQWKGEVAPKKANGDLWLTFHGDMLRL
jgi:hypothetical protein